MPRTKRRGRRATKGVARNTPRPSVTPTPAQPSTSATPATNSSNLVFDVLPISMVAPESYSNATEFPQVLYLPAPPSHSSPLPEQPPQEQTPPNSPPQIPISEIENSEIFLTPRSSPAHSEKSHPTSPPHTAQSTPPKSPTVHISPPKPLSTLSPTLPPSPLQSSPKDQPKPPSPAKLPTPPLSPISQPIPTPTLDSNQSQPNPSQTAINTEPTPSKPIQIQTQPEPILPEPQQTQTQKQPEPKEPSPNRTSHISELPLRFWKNKHVKKGKSKRKSKKKVVEEKDDSDDSFDQQISAEVQPPKKKKKVLVESDYEMEDAASNAEDVSGGSEHSDPKVFRKLSSKAKHSKFNAFIHDFACENLIDSDQLNHYGLSDYLSERNLLKSFHCLSSFPPEVVYEFYNGIHDDFDNVQSDFCGVVTIRGRTYKVTSDLIIDTLGFTPQEKFEADPHIDKVCRHITGNYKTTMPTKLRTSALTSLFGCHHKILINNWLPSGNASTVTHQQAFLLYKIDHNTKFDLGEIIRQNIWDQTSNTDPRHKLPYPSLIFSLLLKQGFVKSRTEKMTSRVPPLTIERFLDKKTGRVVDLPLVKKSGKDKASFSAAVGTSVGNTSGSTSGNTEEDMQNHPLQANLNKLDTDISRIVGEIKGLEQAKAALIETRNALFQVISSQKGGEDCGGGSIS